MFSKTCGLPVFKSRWFALVALIGILGACQGGADVAPQPAPQASGTAGNADGQQAAPMGQPFEAKPLAKLSVGGGKLLTKLGSDVTGVRHQNTLPSEYTGRWLNIGAGAAAGDYDNDGLPDLYLVSETGTNRLYRNLGDWRFQDVTAKAGVAVDRKAATGRFEQRFSMGAQFADVDGDGDLDLFVTAFAGSNTLFQNNGDGTFSDVTKSAGVLNTEVAGSTSTTFADYDHDGDLDFFVATYRPFLLSKFYPRGPRPPEPELDFDLRKLPNGSVEFSGRPPLLYRNDGHGVFTDVAAAAGLPALGWGMAAMFADVDGDGWPDLYVANDHGEPDWFLMNAHDGTFKPAPREAYRHSSEFSMGMDIGDLNNDGFLDFMTSDIKPSTRLGRQLQVLDLVTLAGNEPPFGSVPQLKRNSLHMNNGNGTFDEVGYLAGVDATDWTSSVKFADLDLDGLQDILVTNGLIHDDVNGDEAARIANVTRAAVSDPKDLDSFFAYMRSRPRLAVPHFAFRNQGNLHFQNEAAKWGFDDDEVANGLALADFDGDGDQDIVVSNMNDPVGIYRNDAPANRLKVALRGQGGNRFGIGARVTIETAAGRQVRELSTSGGYLSGHEPVAVFGLGDATTVKELRVDWPSGRRSTVKDVAANLVVQVMESEDAPPPEEAPAAPKTQFVEVAEAMGVQHRHVESSFDDFTKQPLLTFKLTQFGPGVAWGDRDGDGFDDLAIAGSNSNPGGVFINQGGKQFVAGQVPEPPGPGIEEQAIFWWPAAPGKPRDLVASLTSQEIYSPTSPVQPIVRRTPGEGGGAWNARGEANAGALAAADYNGDGELDLFVGGRVRTLGYGLPVTSSLFSGSPAGLVPGDADAPGLAGVGMVSGALWSDVDADGDPDLLLATDLGPVRLFQNNGGKLTEATEAAGLAGTTGLWHGLASGDVDHDGDIDFIATNVGLNSRLRASREAPYTIYITDLDGDGDTDPVEAEWSDGTLFPFWGWRDLAFLVKPLQTQFTSFAAFASAPITEVLGTEVMAKATRREANTLAHTRFLNDGHGRFTPQPLPEAAQVMAGYGVVLADLDDDGHDDVAMSGNFYGAESMHTGPLDGGVGVILLGNGKGEFAAVATRESGFSLPFEAKGLAATDFDQDGWVDLAAGVNNGFARLFHNTGVAGRSGAGVRLRGPAGNPDAAGARITVTRADGLVMTREVAVGSSFLSQNGGIHVFGLGEGNQAAEVAVRWPDGAQSKAVAVKAGGVLEISR